jgi:hypothetical protein
MTRQRKITTAVSLRRREAAARRTQAATDPGAEIERLETHISELLAKIRQRDLVIAGLRSQLDDVECEEGE